MTVVQETVTSWARSARAMGAREWLVTLFIGWLALAVIGPDKAYRIYFHGLIYPLTLYLLVRGQSGIHWRDPFLRLFLLFCGYMAVTTWLVGDVPAQDDAKATRWGLEAALGMLAFFIWMPRVLASPLVWGRVFLIMAIAGAAGGFLLALSGHSVDGRLVGLGAMDHAIQGPSIIIVFTAIGFFLLHSGLERWTPGYRFLLLSAMVVVTLFTVLTKSRAPIGALAIYVLFIVLLLLPGRGGLGKMAGVGAALVVALACVHWLVGLPVLLEQMLARGDSYRADIWYAYLAYPPESLWLGNGAGMGPEYTSAARMYLEPRELSFAHPHNLWLGTYSETGLIGLAMLLGLVGLLAWSALRFGRGWTEKLHLLGLLGLFGMLTFTDEHSLLLSLKPIWLFGWIPLVFVWCWAWYGRRQAHDDAAKTGTGEAG